MILRSQLVEVTATFLPRALAATHKPNSNPGFPQTYAAKLERQISY